MMTTENFGFTEIGHTADWALKVWAPDLPTLFRMAAEGMYSLTETTLEGQPRIERTIEIEGTDTEDMLVSFLAELLYLSESEGFGFDQFQVSLRDSTLQAVVYGAPIAEQKKEIKAVTYHNLLIRRTPAGFSVTIVFDV
jgi:SHS2 domain-containing protein